MLDLSGVVVGRGGRVVVAVVVEVVLRMTIVIGFVMMRRGMVGKLGVRCAATWRR